ncbi:MAG: gamma-glutamyl-gamma-aminobutyrate hydrolase family protein [bacterium]|nr:gamma-glutamyl-gamma-aminobutyrate hydrolase family protein [bacterium]
MKKTTLTTLILIIIFICTLSFQAGIAGEKTRIVIVNPSLGYTKSFIFLVENGIINIPDMEFVGVVYENSKHEYDKIRKFLEENKYPYFSIEKVGGNLTPATLFERNSCSQDFYRLFSGSDGILFLGGPDMPSVTFGSKTSLHANITNPHRHFFELSFLFHLLGGSQDRNFKPYLEEKNDYVVNAFCLGLQTMNVAAGGTLYQDIPSEVYSKKYIEDILELKPDRRHKAYKNDLYAESDMMWCSFHRIKLKKDMFFVTEMGLDPDALPYVLSAHHQAVRKMGKDLKIAAVSMDGKIVEALEHTKYENVYSVQFHPEFSSLYDPEGEKFKFNPDDENMVSIYEIVKEKKTMQFHKKYWEYFGTLFRK